MPARTLKVPTAVRDLIRQLHRGIKRKVRAALTDILEDPACGKPLEKNLGGYWSLGVGRNRIIYRPDEEGVEIVAIGPRRTIYEETAYQILRGRARD
ncbi:MAG: type II toxin-antitoxin system RelE/ParE family toxin [Deltaproteobacteria bacterium]|nr:type II toxin-antitoxin system RelE/ParE family toxin [Deltaproteobacteria bacterium]MCH7911508.1 type II toxin-antitoxin system RelE/ParE family toxin [Deltaproteobacteria bacterium]